jgi:hypothetical protein
VCHSTFARSSAAMARVNLQRYKPHYITGRTHVISATWPEKSNVLWKELQGPHARMLCKDSVSPGHCGSQLRKVEICRHTHIRFLGTSSNSEVYTLELNHEHATATVLSVQSSCRPQRLRALRLGVCEYDEAKKSCCFLTALRFVIVDSHAIM